MKKILICVLFLLSALALFAAQFEKPVTLTSIGQSADVQMVKTLLKKASIEAKFDKLITASGLTNEKTLILAIGGSSKGLGAAGIKAEDELARAEKLVKAAKDKNIKIIGMHIGGEARRGDLSDKFVRAAAPYCDYLIVVKDGNKDGLFTKTASEKNIPLEVIAKITASLAPLKKAFQ